MGMIYQEQNTLVWKNGHEILKIKPWGEKSFRISVIKKYGYQPDDFCLLPQSQRIGDIIISSDKKLGTIIFNSLRAEITEGGVISFYDQNSPHPFLKESNIRRGNVNHPRYFLTQGNDNFSITQSFCTDDTEKFYGGGQFTHGMLNQKGCILDMRQRNMEVTIPFVVSNKKYGFLWNNPSIGRVEFGRENTRWISNSTKQIDYIVIKADSYADIHKEYSELTGYSPMMREDVMGFWQCKLRYRNQEELLKVAREYKARNIPLDVIVIDFFNWFRMGDFEFNKKAWPDPKTMIKELSEMGIKVMVSIWPCANENSENYDEMKEQGYLLLTERGIDAAGQTFGDADMPGRRNLAYFDPSTTEARSYIWNKMKKGFFDYGIDLFWLDACEPELRPSHQDHFRMAIGNMEEYGNIYPYFYEQAFYEGMLNAGVSHPLNLCRSAWAGSQRFGVVLWSGDVMSNFEDFRAQLPAALNTSMSGLPWWTSDIGGFYGADVKSPEFHELFIRWFQFALFCPIFRLHGYRKLLKDVQFGKAGYDASNDTGEDNEVWSYTNQVYEIAKDLILIREKMKPYIKTHMEIAHTKGIPPMRPVFYDFEHDPEAYQAEEQFLFGTDILVAPVMYQGATDKKIYLPLGAYWTHQKNNKKYTGGQWIKIPVDIQDIPIFFKNNAKPF
ncbi:MAG: glycoside hydrolase family 31 protein [Brevinema sp.]